MLAIFREHGRVNGLELRFRAKGGQTLEVLYFNVKVTIRGKPHLLAIAQDITERTRAEEERQALHAKLIRQTQQLEAVRRVSAEITREMQMTALLKQIIQHAMHLVGGVNGSVLLWDDGRQRLVPGVWLGRTPVSHGVGIGLGEGVTGTVAAQRRGMIVNDYRTSSFARPAILEETEITAGMAEPLLYQDRLIGVINIDNGDTGRPFTEEHGELLRLFADQAAIAIENARLYDELKQSYNRLQSLAARAAEAEEGERRRLARELHDQVGQSLSALGLNLTILLGQHERMPDPASRCRLADSLTLVERTAAAIRGVMTDLRPGVLDDYGLVAALHGLGDEMAARTGIVVDVQAEELVPRLAASVENALFRIAQEALTNVMKHARASEVTVSLDAEDRVVRLVIADNGTGFELGRPQAPHDVRHWGLSAMAERALGVGGRCRVDSRPGKGTHVIVEVPR
jgi:signal transduction histidine kinase